MLLLPASCFHSSIRALLNPKSRTRQLGRPDGRPNLIDIKSAVLCSQLSRFCLCLVLQQSLQGAPN